MFNLNPEIGDEDRGWLFSQIQSLGQLPSVGRLQVGRLLSPTEEWYKPRLATDFEWALTMDFVDEAGLYQYQKDPLHVTVAQEIRKRVTGIKITDFVSVGERGSGV
jgi:hypothetical protein